MYSYGPLHMDEQRKDDQLEPTYSSSVLIRDVAQRTCRKQWTIGRGGKRGSGISVLIVRHDNDVSILKKEMFLVKHRIVQVQPSPFSPKLPLCNFVLVPKLKVHHSIKINWFWWYVNLSWFIFILRCSGIMHIYFLACFFFLFLKSFYLILTTCQNLLGYVSNNYFAWHRSYLHLKFLVEFFLITRTKCNSCQHFHIGPSNYWHCRKLSTES